VYLEYSVKSSVKSFFELGFTWVMSIFWQRESRFKGNRTTLQTIFNDFTDDFTDAFPCHASVTHIGRIHMGG
jgi:hypothetical protein